MTKSRLLADESPSLPASLAPATWEQRVPASTLAARTLSGALITLALSWWLGFEQVLPGVVLAVGCWRLWRRGSLDWGIEAFLFSLLVVWSLPSMAALDSRADWLLYLRGEAHLVVGLAAYLVASAVDPATAAFARFLKVAMAFVASLVATSVLVVAGVLPLDFEAPAALLWPGLEGASEFVDDFLLQRRLGTSYGQSLLPGIDRQSLFFLYQGGLATALMVLSGWMLAARSRLAGAWRTGAVAAVGAALVLIFVTGSRSGIVLLWGVVGCLVVWTTIAGKSWRRWLIRVVVLALLVGGVVAVIPHGDGSRLYDGAPWERVLVDFRVKSFLDRLEVYTETIDKLNQRPLTGWGIQGRPGERNRYLRLGTHSEPLNVAFRFGWVGLGLLVAAAWFYARRLAWRSRGRPESPALVLVVVALGLTALVRTFQWDLNVYWLVMAFLGTTLARPGRSGDGGPADEISMLGVRLHPRTIEEIHSEMGSAVSSGRKIVIGHQNLHGLYLAGRDPDMRRFAECADRVFFDGMAVVWLARALGHEVGRRHRVTYADWLDPLAAECARQGWRLAHLGGRPGVGERARRSLCEAYPELEMATYPGYFDVGDEAQLVSEINRFGPQVLMVGMGMPRQEAWVLRNADKIDAGVILTCGACMDYRAGVIATPPRWAGRVGLEWLFRLAREPRRLAARYLLEPWPVLWRLLREWSSRDRPV